MNSPVIESEEHSYSLQDYFAILRRRLWPMIFCAGIVAIFAILIALLLPAKYTSQATILIEEQEVPREFVISTITSYAAQQIQVISQRVLTADNIAGIADKFELFIDPDTNRRPPATQIADVFRNAMSLDLVSADVINPQSGRAQEATIAFTLAYSNSNPATAQRVTNELVTLFLDENLRNRSEKVASTEAFLARQAANLNDELNQIESDIAELKKADGAALPEMFQYNVGSLDRTSADISDIDRRLRGLSRNRTELGAELGMTNPTATRASSTGEAIMSLREQLSALQREYEQKSTRYQSAHPDLLAVKRQIAKLKRQLRTGEADLSASAASNPNYILLRTRLDAVTEEIASLREKRIELQAKADRFQELISRSPTVEITYNSKLRELENVQARYREVRARQREAKLSESMEEERKGERFVMVEPPDLPISPSSPNRPVIALVGLLLALGAGVGLALLLETLDNAVHDERMLTRLSGAPPFATVGYIVTAAETRQAALLRRRLLMMTAGAVVLALVFVHFMVKSLDIIWFMLLGRFGL